jgi:hypothetical protein
MISNVYLTKEIQGVFQKSRQAANSFPVSAATQNYLFHLPNATEGFQRIGLVRPKAAKQAFKFKFSAVNISVNNHKTNFRSSFKNKK